MAGLSILGLAGLSFLLGAAVIYFHLPSSAFLDRAFSGAVAWHERGGSSNPSSREGRAAPGEIAVDKPGKTWDGFTLYTTTEGTRAMLLDMRGEVVHQWQLPFRQAWPHAPQVPRPLPEEKIHWFRCHLFPNGDLLAVYQSDGDTPCGYGLAKLDKDSRLLWAYPGNVHHDVDVGEDGAIYALTHKLLRDPPPGLEFLPRPLVADSVVVLSPEGQELDSIPILEAFRDSPYAPMLASLEKDPNAFGSTGGWPTPPPPPTLVAPQKAPTHPVTPPVSRPKPPPTPQPLATLPTGKGDHLHPNSVRVLSRALASKFPLFQPGQVLVSFRNLDALVVLDRQTRSVAWAARSVWHCQHDAEFLDNGHILLYDNSGWSKGSRIIEYDPVTQALPWVYANEDSLAFRATYRGAKQRLPNGNTLIVDPDNARLLEVTPAKEPVWEAQREAVITGAHRYAPGELTFLKGDVRARP